MKMQFPMPVSYMVIPKGKRKSERQWLGHWAELDFTSISDAEAPVAARFDMDFPDGVFAYGYRQSEYKAVPFHRPVTEIRTFNGDLYVPLYHYHGNIGQWPEKPLEDAPVRVSFDNFIERFVASHRKFVTSFQDLDARPSGNRIWTGSGRNLDVIHKVIDDSLPTPATVEGKIERGDPGHELQQLQAFTKEVIFINNDAWVRIWEPTIKVELSKYAETATFSISQERNDLRYEENVHVFRLDRLADAQAHIKDNFPRAEIVEMFGDLSVSYPQVFLFEDEVGPLHASAKKFLQQAQNWMRNMSADEADAWYGLRDALKAVVRPTEETADQVVQATEMLMAVRWRENHDVPVWLKAATERWKMRPIRVYDEDNAPAL
jgi:hypothetical protein